MSASRSAAPDSFIPLGSTVLITGVTGFVGAHVAQQALQAGYRVRAVVRSAAQASVLVSEGSWAYPHRSAFSTVVIPDQTLPGVFESSGALNGDISAVVHVATPIPQRLTDAAPSKELLQTVVVPAIESTVSLLQSTARTPSVRRFIYTSSLVAHMDPTQPNRVLTADDWSPIATLDHAQQVKNGFEAYVASKVLAERAAWDFVKPKATNGSTAASSAVSFDLVTINPSMVLGPVLPVPGNADTPLTASLALFNTIAHGGPSALPPKTYMSSVDVRDLAAAYVSALQRQQASGHRFLLASTGFTDLELQDWIKTTDHIQAQPGGAGRTAPVRHNSVQPHDSSAATELLGFQPRSKQATFDDTLTFLRRRPKAQA